jgi:hypothetical protein
MTQAEQQYIDLYSQTRQMIAEHSAPALNALRDKAYEDFKRQGFPSRKVERYKYTDMQELFAPDYGLNINRIDIPSTLMMSSIAMCPTSALLSILSSMTSSTRKRCRRHNCPRASSWRVFATQHTTIPTW